MDILNTIYKSGFGGFNPEDKMRAFWQIIAMFVKFNADDFLNLTDNDVCNRCIWYYDGLIQRIDKSDIEFLCRASARQISNIIELTYTTDDCVACPEDEADIRAGKVMVSIIAINRIRVALSNLTRDKVLELLSNINNIDEIQTNKVRAKLSECGLGFSSDEIETMLSTCHKSKINDTCIRYFKLDELKKACEQGDNALHEFRRNYNNKYTIDTTLFDQVDFYAVVELCTAFDKFDVDRTLYPSNIAGINLPY